MISVQNPLQLLSGNKGIKLVIIAAVFAAGMSSYAQKPGAVVAADKAPFQREYQVAVMLPFYLNSADGLGFKELAIKDRIADYYEGVLLAIEDLEAKGMKMKLHVYDTQKDSMQVISILKKPEMMSMDLFIGPVFDSELVEVEKFCAVYNIPLVSPLKYYSRKTVADFPLLNHVPADSMLYYYMGDMAARSFPRHQVVVMDDIAKSAVNANSFRKGYKIAAKKEASVVDLKTPVNTVWNGKDSLLVFAISKNSNAMRAATAVNMPKATVVGMADWLDFDLTGYEIYENKYFCDPYFTDQQDTVYKEIRKRFRNRFGGDPQRYTLIGYDQFNFFGDALMAFGRNFPEHIQNKNFQYPSLYFRFVKRGSIYENAGLNLFRFSGYKTYRVTWRD